MSPRKQPVALLFVVAPPSLLLAVAGPAEAFRLANLRLTDRKQPPHFKLRFAGPVPKVPTSIGLPLAELEPLPKSLDVPTWVVVVGQPSVHVKAPSPAIHAIAQWLRRVVREALQAP